MGKAKEEIRRLLEKLPEDVSYEDVQYHIYVQQAAQRGLDAADRGEIVTQQFIGVRPAFRTDLFGVTFPPELTPEGFAMRSMGAVENK
jgi:hypothetical protein